MNRPACSMIRPLSLKQKVWSWFFFNSSKTSHGLYLICQNSSLLLVSRFPWLISAGRQISKTSDITAPAEMQETRVFFKFVSWVGGGAGDCRAAALLPFQVTVCLYGRSSGTAWGSFQISSVRIVGHWLEFWTQDLPNRMSYLYPLKGAVGSLYKRKT